MYKVYRQFLDSPRWLRLANTGARPQRLLWASTGTKDPRASDILYVKALASPFTVNTIPEPTLQAFAEHGELLPSDGGDGEKMIAKFAHFGVDHGRLDADLQIEGTESIAKSCPPRYLRFPRVTRRQTSSSSQRFPDITSAKWLSRQQARSVRNSVVFTMEQTGNSGASNMTFGWFAFH
jgi:hypothetical protein